MIDLVDGMTPPPWLLAMEPVLPEAWTLFCVERSYCADQWDLRFQLCAAGKWYTIISMDLAALNDGNAEALLVSEVERRAREWCEATE